jgi:hypothetical protein
MASSVVYAGVFGAVLASIRSLRTSVVAFDTSVADLTGQLSDPVDVLFGTQLGGGTDINRAVAYCQQLITRPASTIFILISDLFEGGDRDQMLRRIADMTAAGTQVITLLALSDDGAPGYDHENAAALAGLGVIAFACTPDAFPDLMAAAIERRDITQWAQRQSAPPSLPSRARFPPRSSCHTPPPPGTSECHSLPQRAVFDKSHNHLASSARRLIPAEILGQFGQVATDAQHVISRASKCAREHPRHAHGSIAPSHSISQMGKWSYCRIVRLTAWWGRSGFRVRLTIFNCGG